MIILQILLSLFLYDIFKVFASKLFIVLVEMNIKRKKKNEAI